MNPSKGQVRRAEVEDAPDIATVHVQSWQSAYAGLVPQGYLDGFDPADRLELWQHAVRTADWPRSGVLVGVVGGVLSGFSGFGATRDADGDPHRVGEVFAIYLHPGAWDKGLGQSLMTGTVASLAAAGYRQATLWVLEANARARQFYAKGGWVEDGAVAQDNSHGFAISEVRYRRHLP